MFARKYNHSRLNGAALCQRSIYLTSFSQYVTKGIAATARRLNKRGTGDKRRTTITRVKQIFMSLTEQRTGDTFRHFIIMPGAEHSRPLARPCGSASSDLCVCVREENSVKRFWKELSPFNNKYAVEEVVGCDEWTKDLSASFRASFERAIRRWRKLVSFSCFLTNRNNESESHHGKPRRVNLRSSSHLRNVYSFVDLSLS